MAIKKTLGGALSFFKKRVYRGANVIVENEEFVGANVSEPAGLNVTAADVVSPRYASGMMAGTMSRPGAVAEVPVLIIPNPAPAGCPSALAWA
jgi:hypothetical protein